MNLQLKKMMDNKIRKVWYKLKHFWRRGDNDGDDTAQDRDDGTGDLIFNTLTKIVKDGDKSLWAIFAFIACAMLLVSHKRWPNEMNTGYEGKLRIVFYIRKIFKIKSKKPYTRPQHDMTRDPYIALGSCYTHLLGAIGGTFDHILTYTFEAVKIPKYLYKPNTWIWWQRLKKDNRPHFRKRLSYFKARAIVDKFEKFDEDDFYKDI